MPRIEIHQQLISWDVDGTLYDNRAMRRMAWRTALMHPVAAARELLPVRRFNWAMETNRRRRGGVLGSDLARFDRARLCLWERRWATPAIAAVGPRPGVKRALEHFAATGHIQVVLSDYRARYKVELLGLADFFTALYAGEDLGFIKPRPEGLERIAQDFGLRASDILHIGDGVLTDGAAARAAGCQCLILGRDFGTFNQLVRQLPWPR